MFLQFHEKHGRSGRNSERADGKVINCLLKNYMEFPSVSPAQLVGQRDAGRQPGACGSRSETEPRPSPSPLPPPSDVQTHLNPILSLNPSPSPTPRPVCRAAAPHHIEFKRKQCFFLKNSHTNNLITPCLGLDIRRLLPGKKKKKTTPRSLTWNSCEEERNGI